MEITNAKYTQSGSISATVDGIEMTIPIAPGNRHYNALIEQGIEIAPYVEPAKTAEEIRVQRNQLLSSCDWTQVADAPVDRSVWTIYRQALRDITKQSGFPTSVLWPEVPV
jgi:hypothetical protein